MPTATHPEFNADTEGLEVAKAFQNEIHGKNILVTGVNPAGIGFTTVQAFASQSPAHLIVAGRSQAKLDESIKLMKVDYPSVDYKTLIVDLSSQKSVHSAAAEFMSWADVPTLDIVVNNAAVMGIPERTITEDGIEKHFATNHIGHFLLTCLIMPKIIKAAEGKPKGATRIVNVSADARRTGVIRWSDINFGTPNKDIPEAERPDYALPELWGYKDVANLAYTGIQGYCQSKVANVLFSIGVTHRLYEKYGILSLAVHPGIIMTELPRNFPQENMTAILAMLEKLKMHKKTLGAGASTSLVAALDPAMGPGEMKDGKENFGAWLMDCQVSNEANPLGVSSSEAEKLWPLSEKLVGEKFEW
ncbi:NAD(P)-binding protein [Xylariaceae sp. FL0255]|nr:NAD(P)-binding protein [Xylariaceae sp. FL0255]